MPVREMANTELATVMDLHLEGLAEELELLARIFPGKSVDRSGRDGLLKLLTQIVTTGEARIFVALEGSDYAGYCLATKKLYPVENPRLAGSVNGIYVRPDFRRRGLGRGLFEAAAAWLKSQGAGYIELYHMINDGRAATFWKEMGFIPVQINCAKKL